MNKKTWGAAALAGLLAMSGATVGTTTAFAAPETVEIDDASFEWGYSKYAQIGVMSAWKMSVTGDDLELTQKNGQDVTGDPADAARSFNLAVFTGGHGSINPHTGAGHISWDSGAQWTVQVTSPAGSPPAVVLSDPMLTIEDDATGTLSFDVSATAGSSMTGEPSPAVPAARIVTQTFSQVTVNDGTITATPDFAGIDSGSPKQIAGGGSWPQAYIAHIPAAIQDFHFQTALTGLNLNKAPLPFTVTTGEATTPVQTQPKIELFHADGTALGNREVVEGEVITFRGSGFDPAANNPGGQGQGLPIPDNLPQGVFIAFGAVADPWQPSQQGPAEHRAQVRANTKWALTEAVLSSRPEPLQTTLRAQSVEHRSDGTFEGTIIAAEPAQLPEQARFGVYTYAGGVATVNSDQELFVPVNFAAKHSGGGTVHVPTSGKELVWGFKQSWRDYLSGAAAADTVAGAGARVGDDGLFRFALADDSGYHADSGEGVIKYDGRIRFMSDTHEFDIVMEKPWVTLSDGGSTATISMGMSTVTDVGDLTVSRVDVVRVTGVNFEAQQIDGAAYRVWNGLSGNFLASIQPDVIRSFYTGQASDKMTFSIPAKSDAGGTPVITDGSNTGNPAQSTGKPLANTGAEGEIGVIALASILVLAGVSVFAIRAWRRERETVPAEETALNQ